MKKVKLISAVALLSAGLNHTAIAEESTIESTWAATAELGFVMTGGNTETEILNAKLNAEKSCDHGLKHTLLLEALNSSSNDTSSAERYFAETQTDKKLSDRAYALGVVSWEHDRFSGFDHQTTIALGAGYKAIAKEDMELDFELAPGYRVVEDNNGNNEEDGIIRAAENFSWKFSKTSSLGQSLNTVIGDSNTTTRFGISLSSQLQDALSMKVGYHIKHNSKVPEGSKKTDRETSVTLVYKL